jgi:uncharacterized DUF497 family protein
MVMGRMAGFSWDDAKSLACKTERGFDFAYAARLWQNPVLEREDTRFPYGEVRIQALGRIDGIDFVVIYTWRGTRRHIISARRAHRKEVVKWQE